MWGIIENNYHNRRKHLNDNLNFCTYNGRSKKELVYILPFEQTIDEINPYKKKNVCQL